MKKKKNEFASVTNGLPEKQNIPNHQSRVGN